MNNKTIDHLQEIIQTLLSGCIIPVEFEQTTIVKGII